MKIKRFFAQDMRTALRLVREEQGPNAVILSNRRVEGGVEVVSATDYDESLVQQSLTAARRSAEAAAQQAAASALPAAPEPRVAAPAHISQMAPAPVDTLLPPRVAQVAAAARAEAMNPRLAARQAAAALAAAPAAAATAPFETPQRPLTALDTVERITSRRLSKIPDEVQQLCVEDPQIAEMKREMALMRQSLKHELDRFSDQRMRLSPARAAAFEELAGYGCDEAFARSIVERIPADADPARSRGMLLGLLAKSLQVCAEDPISAGGVIALVGPTGVGKTTTLAKLAARYAAHHSARDVALVTTDGFRIGAREQLFTYGRLLGMPVIEVSDPSELGDTLDRLGEYRLVLVDTAGLSHRDIALGAQLGALAKLKHVNTQLVLPANTHADDLDEVVRRFSIARPRGVVLSKVDETGRLGSALSVTVRHRLPISYLTDGQRVPEDLHRAEAHRLALRVTEQRRASAHAVEEIAHVAG
ncbi:flagellar biosynthesis protein FlhF [Aquimonas sp.]|jgi:flagellar biosynthesis protein FlhF|uniref:flagellar biosynthesis protein FlhF n=1 Tax=Aquimonas sp. TaxID=1872588 RepID=UPI0037BFC929